MKKPLYYSSSVLGLAIAAILVGSARANETAITFSAPPTDGGAGTGAFGWQFRTDSDISLSALGLYDSAGIYGGGFIGDGLLEEHAIRIWDVSDPSTPLVSALLPGGTLAPLASGFRFVNIDPVVLPANHDYVIAAFYSDLPRKDFTVGTLGSTSILAVGPGLEFGGYRSLSSSVFAFPEHYMAGREYAFGPNFTYTLVPEPPVTAIVPVGLLALHLCRRRTTLRPARAAISPCCKEQS